MRDFRRFVFRFRPHDFYLLPPVLRVASILGLLFSLASVVVLASMLVVSLRSSPQSPLGVGPLFILTNLNTLSGACNFAVNFYRKRLRRPDRRPFSLSSWQSQVLAIVLLAALPTCALVLEFVAPLTPSDLVHLFVVGAISGFAALMIVAAWVWMLGVRA